MRKRRPLALLGAAALVLVLALATGVRAEVTATHDTVISFDSKISPNVLPRNGTVPVRIVLEGHIKARHRLGEPAALTKIELAINRAADLKDQGLPVCDIASIDPATSAQALAACGPARLGQGEIRAQSVFPGAPHHYFDGHVLIFNGRLEDGRPAILLHVFNVNPPSSIVFPLTVSHRPGTYGTVLTAGLRLGHWSRITDFRLVLDRTYRWHGQEHSFLSAGCPAPRGFTIGIAPFVLATLNFSDQTKKSIPVVSSCRVAR